MSIKFRFDRIVFKSICTVFNVNSNAVGLHQKKKTEKKSHKARGGRVTNLYVCAGKLVLLIRKKIIQFFVYWFPDL